jgi:hypothetical protein
MVVPLRLDRFGNGSYDFKDGRFRTDVPHRSPLGRGLGSTGKRSGRRIRDHTVAGFTRKAKGRWWYTRIESDAAPTKAGGTFHVMKVQSIVENQPVPGARASQ